MMLLDTIDNMPSTMPQPFGGKKISSIELKNFIYAANSDKKCVIVFFGANWCPDAQCLEAVMQLPTVKTFCDHHFSVIHIDVGDYDTNMHLMPEVGLPTQEGIPRLVIIDLFGKPVNLASNDKWRSARNNSSQDIFDYLQAYAIGDTDS
ncbi:MAG: thioredoxin family protein [Porticoccaceae bacterium]|nr:thioredoxin family protein [Porticoccaceae bacterium]MDG1475354.1 thioredoxin family protein [Porticoccaceae bacterium]